MENELINGDVNPLNFKKSEMEKLHNKIINGFQEEPKQETLEEFAERLYPNYQQEIFIKGAKWQQQRSYSEEEVKEQLNLILAMKNSLLDTFTNDEGFITDKWFEQFKKNKI